MPGRADLFVPLTVRRAEIPVSAIAKRPSQGLLSLSTA